MRKLLKSAVFLALFSTKLQALPFNGQIEAQAALSFNVAACPLLSRIRCYRKLTFLRHVHFLGGVKAHLNPFSKHARKETYGLESYGRALGFFVNPSSSWSLGFFLCGQSHLPLKQRQMWNAAEEDVDFYFEKNKDVIFSSRNKFDMKSAYRSSLFEKNKSLDVICGPFVEYQGDRFALSVSLFDLMLRNGVDFSGMWQPLPQPTLFIVSLQEIQSIRGLFSHGSWVVQHPLTKRWDGLFSLSHRSNQKWTIGFGFNWALNRDQQSMGRGILTLQSNFFSRMMTISQSSEPLRKPNMADLFADSAKTKA